MNRRSLCKSLGVGFVSISASLSGCIGLQSVDSEYLRNITIGSQIYLHFVMSDSKRKEVGQFILVHSETLEVEQAKEMDWRLPKQTLSKPDRVDNYFLALLDRSGTPLEEHHLD